MFPNHLVITEAASYLNREDATTQDQVHIQSLKELLFCLTGCPNMEKEGYLPFGHISLPPYQVFYASSFSFCSVNLKPFVPGHILVIPRRNVPTLDLLTEEEAADLMLVTRKMIRFIKEYYHVNSVTVAIQDGPPAGQTIPDVHVHIMPREYGDFKENDVVYDMLDEADILPHSIAWIPGLFRQQTVFTDQCVSRAARSEADRLAAIRTANQPNFMRSKKKFFS